MMSYFQYLVFAMFVGLTASCSLGPKEAVQVDMEEVKDNFKPLPKSIINTSRPYLAKRIELGKKLYFEKRLSLANDISCNSCHGLDQYGVDGESTSPGHKGQRGDRNSPTVYNAAIHISQFWDGRAKNVEAQAIGPILNPIEMAMPSEKAVLKRLRGDKNYVAMFKASFPKHKWPLSYKNIGNAIGAFERTLLTPSRFDQFLKGEESALTNWEKKGLNTFMEVGCTSCHNGAGIGGGMYEKLGVVEEYETKDMGRYNVTKNPDDKKVFKVPSLRNIAETGPYFHDGSIQDLDDVVKVMGKHQLGMNLTKGQVKDIVVFLKSLTGELPKI